MSDTDQYPNSTEVRTWAQSKKAGGSIGPKGRLPRYVVLAWNRAHPDRPYVPAQGHHGTYGGYTSRGCRCDRCVAAGRAHDRDTYRADRDDRDDAMADDLLDGAR